MKRAAFRRGFLPTAILASLLAAPAFGGAPAPAIAGRNIDAIVAEAAQRFAIPTAWIYAVMRRESAGNARALSPKGASGLMQIMPATWAGLRARYRLGVDIFDPHDNILAGAAYLRELFDRYGSPGFLAAYNAGPGRYEAWLAARKALPDETLAYVAAVGSALGSDSAPLPVAAIIARRDWARSALFARPDRAEDGLPSGDATASPDRDSDRLPRPTTPAPSLFVPLARPGTAR
uniref:lytic transglycosylase domain-containing protein n=1 Tax=Sphingomonas sp. TaxID=28214 RepID=UPI0035655F68